MLGHVQCCNGEDEALETIRRFPAKHSGISVISLLLYLLVYKTKEKIEEIDGGNSHKNAFLEIGVPEQFMKSWKILVEKFTFSSIEAWKPATSLQTNSFIRDLSRIPIKNLQQFLRTVKNKNFTKHYSCLLVKSERRILLVKSERRRTTNIN